MYEGCEQRLCSFNIVFFLGLESLFSLISHCLVLWKNGWRIRLENFAIADKVFKMPRSQSWLHTVFLSLVVVIHLPTGLAQDDPASSTESPTTSSIAPDQPSPTNSAPAQTYTIQVGLADHKFKPEVTTANIGDVSWSATSSPSPSRSLL